MQRKTLISEELLITLVQNNYTIYEIEKETNCCQGTIRSYMKKYKINTPSGFFSKGKKVGRPAGFHHSEEYKKEMSKKFTGDKNPFYGKKHSKATRKKMKENHADFTGDKNPLRKAIKKNPEIRDYLSNIKTDYWNKLTPQKRYYRNSKPIIGELSKYHWTCIKSNAKARNLEFKLTPEYIWKLFLKQERKCALTGILLNIKTDNEITGSIDRIDSNKGYFDENVQWVHKTINIMKSNFPQNTFIAICAMVTKNEFEKTNKPTTPRV